MPIFSVIAEMGNGKTLFASLYALDYSMKNPKNKIYANYKLKLKNFVYTPFMFLPLSQLKNCLIICDDFYSLPNSKNLIGVIVNLSRKKDIDVILTCQYYTMIEKQIRTLSNMVYVSYNKVIDKLQLRIITPSNQIFTRNVKNAVKLAKKIYNTNEVVVFPLESEILIEIKRVSKNRKDIEHNLMLYTKNRTLQKKLLKEIVDST